MFFGLFPDKLDEVVTKLNSVYRKLKNNDVSINNSAQCTLLDTHFFKGVLSFEVKTIKTVN